MKYSLICVLLILSAAQLPSDWTKSARIADVDFWPDFTEEEMKEGIDQAHQQGMSVILAWLTSENIDIPQEDLNALKKAVSYTHATYPDMKFIVYQAPLEIITENVDENQDGKIDKGKTAISTEHPEWLQVGLDGRKAVFYGDIEFWVGKHDEDVWCCPNDPVYREKVKESFKRLAETGIDGIWIDVVLFLCNYGSWENNWACHCEDCTKKFYEDTGLTIPDAVTWDATWKTWVLWRQKTVEGLIDELSQTAKMVNPDLKIIVEHWHGFDTGSTESAWSPLGLVRVTDSLAHEYVSASDSEETYTPVNYVRDVALYTFYRGADKDHATWILSYAVEEDGQRMLAASILEAGCNYYDTNYPDMSDSVSLEERTRIFQWLKEYSDYYYGAVPVSNVALYYSKATVDFYDCPAEEEYFFKEFVGTSMMLLSLHVPYTVVTDLETVQADVLILPNAACLSDADTLKIQEFLEEGGYVLSTGETGHFDEMGVERSSEAFFEGPRAYATDRLFGSEYYEEVAPFFWEDDAQKQGTGDGVRTAFLSFLNQVPVLNIETTASPNVIILPFMVGDDLVLRMITFEGISPGNAVPDVQTVSMTSTRKVQRCMFIPFLSDPEDVAFYDATVTVKLQHHGLLVLKIEPVSIFSNEYDLPAAETLASFLRTRGIPVKFVTSPEEATSVLIVFGGHKAADTGEFVSSLLTDEEKTQLEQPGFNNLFIFQKEKLIIVIAGNEREDTAYLAEKKKREICRLI